MHYYIKLHQYMKNKNSNNYHMIEWKKLINNLENNYKLFIVLYFQTRDTMNQICLKM